MLRPKMIAAGAAFLMFDGELMAGKRLLPEFGGSAYVWYSVVFFFQLLVMAGYYGSRCLAPPARVRNGVLAFLGLTGLLTLIRSWPIPAWLSAELQPMAALLPFAGAGVALFCVTPLLHQSQADQTDYSIYAWSNGGALLGLVAYPFVIEPLAGLTLQNWAWAGGVLLVCAVLPGTAGEMTAVPAEAGLGKTRWEWWVLPAISSATMLATTNQVSYETSPGPLAWALTLGLFLASYVWAFSKDRRKWIGLVATAGLAAVVTTHLVMNPRSLWMIVPLLAAGGATMMTCHAWLASTKGANSHGFYSAMAIGGAAGSALIVLAVPRVTDGPLEFPILVLTTLSMAGFAWGGRVVRPFQATLAVVAIGSTIAAESSGRSQEVARARTLYGCLRVTRTKTADSEYYSLINNATCHGEEDRGHPERCWTYYGMETGIGQLIGEKQAAADQVRVGVVGLGAGTINHLLRPRDSIIYYEINPKVEELARSYFTYLSQPLTRVVLGDGRKLLEQENDADPRLDVLAVDAFSGDAIPMHLLTREAGMIYRRRLKPDGALAIHITNAHVDLLPVVNGLARSMGLGVIYYRAPSAKWVVLRPGPPPGEGRTLEWTDDKSSLLPVLKRPEQGH